MKMKQTRQSTLWLLVLFFLGAVTTQYGETPGKDNLQDITPFLEKICTEFELPGMAVAVIRDGKIIYKQGLGFRDISRKKPVTPDTLFCIGSCTKAFTGLSMALLALERKVKLSAPVVDYLPGFRVRDPHDTANLTVMDLLTHRSGIPDHELAWYGANRSPEELFQALRYLPSSHGLREQYQYNNLMYMVAGMIASRVDQAPYPEIIKKRILTPLGMNASTFSLQEARQGGNLSLPYSKVGDEVTGIDYIRLDHVAPAGAMISNLEDMSRWVLVQLGRGKLEGREIFPVQAVDLTHTPQMIRSSGPGSAVLYSLGWNLQYYRDHPVITHGGGISGFLSLVEFSLKDKFGIVILTNADHSWPVRDLVANVLKDRLLDLKPADWLSLYKKQLQGYRDYLRNSHEQLLAKKLPGTKLSQPLKAFTGTYGHPGYGDFIVTLKNGHLEARLNHFHSPLDHYHNDQFLFTSIPGAAIPEFLVDFKIDDKGRVVSLSAPIQRGIPPVVFKKTNN